MYNAGDRKDVRRAEKAARLGTRQRQSAVVGIMSVSGGRHWMHDILVSCHVFATTFTVDPYATAFNEGQRNIGLQLLDDIMQACPDSYILMMREANERNAATERRSREESNGRDIGAEPDQATGDPDDSTDAIDAPFSTDRAGG